MKNQIKYVDFKKFNDEFGNLLNVYEIILYEKRSNGDWVKKETFLSGRSYFLIDGKIYHRLDNGLFELNMDFDSASCGACYQVGEEVTNTIKITGNQILFVSMSPYNNYNYLELHKQSYSNGTCFYSLKDENKNFNVNRGSSELCEVIKQVKHEIRIHENEWLKDILNKLELIEA